jgi:hypothetical protein
VDGSRSDPPTPRAWAAARATQWREQERAAHARERGIRWRERREEHDEEYRLREQQGLSPPTTSANSSLEEEEEEESDGGCHTPERCNPPPLSPRAAEEAPTASVDAPAVGSSMEEPAVPRRSQRAPLWRRQVRQGVPLNPRGRGSGASPS